MTDTTSTTSTQSTPNEKPKRLYPSTQLIAVLDAKVLKTYLWITTWGWNVRYYSKQFSKAIGLPEDEVERCIQSLIDYKLVDVTNTEQGFVLNPNADGANKYFEMLLGQVLEGDKIKMAETATWSKTTPIQKPKIEDLDADQIKALIIRLKASLKEKEQMKKFVKVTPSPAEKFDDLPF